MNQDDLSFDEAFIPSDEPQPQPKAQAKAPATPRATAPKPAAPFIPVGPQEEFRGVGQAGWSETPVACVVEVLRRKPVGGGKWELIPPFTGTPEGSKWSFGIMGATPSGTNARGLPMREPHPSFAAFNTCPPEKAATLPIIIINEYLEDFWKFNLGMYAAPGGKKLACGWFCQGDGKRARRWNGNGWGDIACPDVACQYRISQGVTKRGDPLPPPCSMNLSLIGQLNWNQDVLPKWTFEWNSKSQHGFANLDGLFRQVQETAFRCFKRNMIPFAGFEPYADCDALPAGVNPFPMFGFPLQLTVAETVKPGKRFPEVHAAPVMNLVEWIRGAAGAMVQRPMLAAPRPLNELPAPGMTQADMDAAAQARLTNYMPANER